MKAAAALMLAAALALVGCAEPIPADKLAYAGDWRAANVQLIISPEGRVEYKRQDGKANVSIQAPIQRFDGDDFVVGVGPFNTRFVVSKPPHLIDGQYKMVVDGVELTRVRAFGGMQVSL